MAAKVMVFVPKGNKTVEEVRAAQNAVLEKMKEGQMGGGADYELVDSAALMSDELDLATIGRLFIAAAGADLLAFGEGWFDSTVLVNVHRVIIEYGMNIAFE